MVLVRQAQLFKGEIVEVVVDVNVIKFVGNLEGKIKGPSSTIIDGDQQLDCSDRLACISSVSSKNFEPVWRGVIEVIIEMTGSILEWRWVVVVASFHGEDVDWIFPWN